MFHNKLPVWGFPFLWLHFTYVGNGNESYRLLTFTFLDHQLFFGRNAKRFGQDFF